MLLSKARDLGLPDKWVRIFEEKQGRRHVIMIRRLVSNSDAFLKLKNGDLLLAVDNTPVMKFRDVEESIRNKDEVELTIFRAQQEMKMSVNTALLHGRGTEKIVFWAGAVLQNPHRALLQLGLDYKGVYCSRYHYGSPAHRYDLRAVFWILEINGEKTPNLEEFLKVIKKCHDKGEKFLRLRLVGMQDKVKVITLKPDPIYWPTWILARNSQGVWQYESL
jgi:S1-C subfamily serine protease